MMLRPNRPIATQLIGAVALVAIIGVAAIHGDRSGDNRRRRPSTPTERDPLARELLRCQTLSTKAGEDKTCEAAWAESRRRFFEMDSKTGTDVQNKDPHLP